MSNGVGQQDAEGALDETGVHEQKGEIGWKGDTNLTAFIRDGGNRFVGEFAGIAPFQVAGCLGRDGNVACPLLRCAFGDLFHDFAGVFLEMTLVARGEGPRFGVEEAE